MDDVYQQLSLIIILLLIVNCKNSCRNLQPNIESDERLLLMMLTNFKSTASAVKEPLYPLLRLSPMTPFPFVLYFRNLIQFLAFSAPSGTFTDTAHSSCHAPNLHFRLEPACSWNVSQLTWTLLTESALSQVFYRGRDSCSTFSSRPTRSLLVKTLLGLCLYGERLMHSFSDH